MILSTNPASEENWTYRHFFKDELKETFILGDQELYKKRSMIIGETYYHHSTAEDNLFLPESYIDQLEDMKNYDPDLHRVARKGHFGVSGNRVLPQFIVESHDKIIKQKMPLTIEGLFTIWSKVNIYF